MKYQQKINTVIFLICLILSVFCSVARADDAKATNQNEEMSQDDREILEAMDSEFSVILKSTK